MQMDSKKKLRLLKLQAEIESSHARWQYAPSASLRKEIQTKIAEYKALETEIEEAALSAINDTGTAEERKL